MRLGRRGLEGLEKRYRQEKSVVSPEDTITDGFIEYSECPSDVNEK